VTDAIAVVGPTASGKTGLAIALAERLGTEIVSADSMQVYKGMEIGSAAPTLEEQARVKHHFVSFLDPSEHYSAAQFSDDARAVIAGLTAQGKTAVIVGGSGLYIRALLDGLFTGPSRDDTFREALRQEAEEVGVPALYERLQRVDPEFAASIHPNDMRRIERGLEVYELSGRPLSDYHREHREKVAPLDAVQVAPDWPRSTLYDRINARVWNMVEAGFVDEVRRLIDTGHEHDLKRLRSRGHPEMAAHVRGECSLDEAVALVQRNTRRLAKRQLSWFRRDDRIHWLPMGRGVSPAGHIESVISISAFNPSPPSRGQGGNGG